MPVMQVAPSPGPDSEDSRGFTVAGRLSLTPSVEVGLRQDGGDAETGAGMDIGGGLVFTHMAAIMATAYDRGDRACRWTCGCGR
jgi:hypothetical protein